ncbi:MAG TPA: ATP-binding protein [Planctomycetota bacterium]|nr:ATP-binding protein [Planctomycetota bacterium]
MPSSRQRTVRALWVLSLLSVAAIMATVVLILSIKRRVVSEHRARELTASVRHAEQCADLLRGGQLLARLRGLVARHANLSSLVEIADEIQAELCDLEEARQGDHELHVLVVDDKLQPVWPARREGHRDLRVCARHILEGRERVYVLPHDCAARGDPPNCLCFTAPIQREGKLLGGLVVHRQLAPTEHLFTRLDRQMTWALLFSQAVLLVALSAIAWSARRALGRAERRRAKDERLIGLGNLAAGVAHEIRNPLNTIALTCRYLERLISKGSDDPALRAEAHANFEIVASELARLTRTLDDVVLLARPSELALGPCDLDAVLDHTLALFAREFEEAKVQLRRERAGPLPIRGDADRLSRVFANVIRNSIQAMRDGGTLAVTSERANGEARVAFADSGPGIAPDHLARLFEPYFTTKRSGLGLGLALSLRIVEGHGGTLAVANQPGGGALVTLGIPLQPDSPEAPHAG